METLVNTNHEILSRHTGQPIEKIVADTSRDYFMSPPEAKDYGIIDAVYSSIGTPLVGNGSGAASTDGKTASETSDEEKGPAAATE
jgi:ATP-dependent Clp protease protease subunit